MGDILKKLPPIVMPNGVRLPRLITRLDLGIKIDGKFRPFLNEIEYVPSLYCADVSKELVNKYIEDNARQIMKITKLYVAGRDSQKGPNKRRAHSKVGQVARSMSTPFKRAHSKVGQVARSMSTPFKRR